MPDPRPSMQDVLAEQVEVFDLLGDWEERYRHVIDLGRTLQPLADDERVEANRVRGCASQVWLVREPGEDATGALRFRGDSDAHIVRGLVALMLGLYSDRTPAEILDFDAKAAVARLGLDGALSTQRANGLASMVARIRAEAEAEAAGKATAAPVG